MKPAGKHPEKALSPMQVRNVSAPGKYGDGNGLYLVVDLSGAKRWLLRTVVKGTRRDIGLGSLKLVSLAEAREESIRLRKTARAGGDPLAERRAAKRVVPTFEAAARTFHTEHKPSWKNPKHAAQWINTLTQYVFPTIGQKQVDQVRSADIMKVMSPIWLDKPETARRVLQRIRAVFQHSKASGHCQGDNPVEGVSQVLAKQKDTATHHAALPYAETKNFIKKLQSADTSSSSLAFEFLILTAARTNEVLEATWDEIDEKAKTWTVPAERMKAEREHRVPLSARCLAILKKARKLAGGSAYVFPGQDPEKPLSNMVFLMALRRMKVGVTAHGFRSTFRDWASEQTSFPGAVCEAALAHTIKDKAEAAYNRTDLFEKRRALMTEWAEYCTPAPSKKRTKQRSA
ncbi:MAG: tyrosine-type recombinase/integrase [Proteobacteria bacterium]|nr:tyrosine-type recombinase/integrase [Pseudomonadota bacterium]